MAVQWLRRAVETRPVATFFVVAYALSWLAWAPILLGLASGSETPFVIAGSFGPAVAGAAVTWYAGDSVRSWAGQIVRWRVPARWYVVVFALPLVVVVLASVGISLLGTDLDLSLLAGRGAAVLSSFLVVALVGGGNEEPGWRGFALPRLQDRYTPVQATLLLGVVWAFWHLPLLPVEPSTLHGLAWLQEFGPSVVLRVLNIVGFAFLLTWVYNATDSVLLPLLAHAGINAANSTLVPLPMAAMNGDAYQTVLLTVTVAVWVVAVVLVAVTRVRLGYGGAGPTPSG